MKLSHSSSPTGPPSTVYAKSQPKPSTSNLVAPVPISSSGPQAKRIFPCLNSGWFIKYSPTVTISATPDLSSEPKSVFPSVVIKVSPIYFFKFGNSFTLKTISFSLFKMISFPS